MTPNACSTATTMVPPTMKAALSTLTRGDDAGAAVGAGPGLHRGEGRHDVEAAGDREAGEIDHHAHAAARSRTPRRRRPARAPAACRRWSSRDRSRTRRAATAPTSVGRITMRPADEPGGEARADRDRDREHREDTRHDFLGAAEHGLHQRRQQRQHDRADQPEPARHQRAPPQPAVAAQMPQQPAGGGGDVDGDLQVGRAGADLAG